MTLFVLGVSTLKYLLVKRCNIRLCLLHNFARIVLARLRRTLKSTRVRFLVPLTAG